MKKTLTFIALLFLGMMVLPTFGQDRDQRIRQNSSNVNSRERAIINKAITQTYENEDSVTVHRTAIDAFGDILVTDSVATGAIVYTDTYWDDLRVPLTNTRLNPANSEPDFEDMGNGAFAWGFDADADSTHALNFVAQLPHSYLVGSDLGAHVHWVPPTTNTGAVRWKLIYYLAAINDTIAGPDSLYIDDAGDGVAYKHQLADFGDIAGDSLGISSMILGKLSRVGDATEDDYTGSAYGLEIDFHFQMDTPGSEEETTKY